MSDSPRELIKKNSDRVVQECRRLSKIEFGLNEASVEWLEGYVERLRASEEFDAAAITTLVSVFGSFLGECLVANAAGQWRRSDEGTWGVVFPNGDAAYPFSKVAKAFENGLAGGDSILSFYQIALNYLATGRLSDLAQKKNP